MPYLWEQPNLGNNLYEMAINRRKALLEATEGNPDTDPTKDEETKPVETKETKPVETKETKPVETKETKPAKKDAGSDNGAEGITIDFAQNKPRLKNVLQQVFAKGGITLDDARFLPADDSHPNGALTLTAEEAKKAEQLLPELYERNILSEPDAKEKKEAASADNREKIIEFIKKQYPDAKIQAQIGMALRFFANGMWFDGSEPTKENSETIKKFQQGFESGDTRTVVDLVGKLEGAISNGKIEIDPANSNLYKVTPEDKKVLGNIQMPSFFETEIDDSMWQDIVITDFGIPLINLGHPCTKKVISSENPEQDCPGELKQFKKAIAAHPELKKVFVQGLDRMLGKAMNLLTLGIAAATTDAGKRADRIIKELKEKGGMSTHRNLLLVKYDDIVNADPDNSDLVVTVKPYNRSTKNFMGEFDIPVSMISKFYSAVDPIKSAKIYMETYSKDDDLQKALAMSPFGAGNPAGGGASGGDITERGVASAAAGAAATLGAAAYAGLAMSIASGLLVAAPGMMLGATAYKALRDVGDNNARNDVSKVTKDKEREAKVEQLKIQYIKLLSEQGHPPYYVLKPKTANKEVDIVSKSSTGQMAGGKVLMVSMQIDGHQAAMFINPAQAKQQFAL